MKVLLDTCVWGGARSVLETAGHNVVWTGDWPQDPGDEEILARHADRERSAWARYTADEALRKKLQDAGITRVTDFYTSAFKYSKKLHQEISEMILETLPEQGLWL